MSAVVRRLLPDDAAAYVELRREALELEPFAFAASPQDDRALSLAFVQQALASPAQATFGAFAPALVGIVGVHQDAHRKASHKAHLWGLYVQPAQRCSGVGRSLMMAAVRYARQLPGVSQLHLAVAHTGKPAIHLYDSLGFVAWGTAPDALRVGTVSVAEHHMMLDLDARPPSDVPDRAMALRDVPGSDPARGA
jgi:ribosomal protein S18 acetylase RimI-like enzyme